MRFRRTILLLICVGFMPACRENNEALKAHKPSNTNGLSARFQMNEGNPGHDFQKDLAEITAMGLVDRAAQDFFTAYPQATVDHWNIGYIWDKNRVWCDMFYRMPGDQEILQKGFGYSRSNGGKWSLMGPLTEEPGSQKMVLNSKRTIQLGTFDVVSGKLVVGDPGYELTSMDSQGAVLTNCVLGKWRARLIEKSFGSPPLTFASELLVFSDEVESAAHLRWTKQPRHIGTDYAQIGVFDRSRFQDASVVPKNMKWTFDGSGPADPGNLWYSYCCELTTKGNRAATIPFGAVSTSGKGDGGYEFQLAYDAAGKVIGVRIVFVDDDGNG